jgi:hypothetical protein
MARCGWCGCGPAAGIGPAGGLGEPPWIQERLMALGGTVSVTPLP